MFYTTGSAMVVVKPASKPLGVEEGIGITCRAICPGCCSDYRLSSKIYSAKQLVASIRLAGIDILGPYDCEVCGLRSQMTEPSMRRLTADVEDYKVKFSMVPSAGKGQGALHAAALLRQIGTKKTEPQHVAFKQSLPTLSIRLSGALSGHEPVVQVERTIVCGVCELRSSRLSCSTVTPRSDLNNVATQLVARFIAVTSCEYCGSLLGLQEETQQVFLEWIIKQLTPMRVAAKLDALRKARSVDLNEQRARLHAALAPDCKRHVNSCERSAHGPQLALQLEMLERWHH